MEPDPEEGCNTIRETLFGSCIGRRILDITTGEGEDEDKVYFHLDNGQTFYATIGSPEKNSGLMGFIDMESDDDDEPRFAAPPVFQ